MHGVLLSVMYGVLCLPGDMGFIRELVITFNTSNFYAFDYLTYTPSHESQLSGEDVIFGSANGAIVELKEPGSVMRYSFTG